MKYKVQIIEDAEQDLFDLYSYIALTDSPAKAGELIDQLELFFRKLETTPHRGRIPPELKRIGVDQYRELIFKVYRIIYQIQSNNVFIHCILDSRRDLQEYLEQRLLR